MSCDITSHRKNFVNPHFDTSKNKTTLTLEFLNNLIFNQTHKQGTKKEEKEGEGIATL